MPWRYQPVWSEEDGERVYTLIEVYFDDAGRFNGWADRDVTPLGESVEELSMTLNHMIVDALSWEPVKRTELRAGIKFTQRISMDDRRAVADFVEHSTEALKRQPKPTHN